MVASTRGCVLTTELTEMQCSGQPAPQILTARSSICIIYLLRWGGKKN